MEGASQRQETPERRRRPLGRKGLEKPLQCNERMSGRWGGFEVGCGGEVWAFGVSEYMLEICKILKGGDDRQYCPAQNK